MEKCKFSETQFEAYHSRSIENLFGSRTYQFFPSRNAEAEEGVDMKHFGPAINLFFQYKVPYSLDKSKVRKPAAKGLPGNLFRFNIYHNTNRFHKETRERLPSQYELLWKLAKKEPFVFYTVPVFNTNEAFGRHYKNIIPCSRHFNVSQMIDPDSDGFNDYSHSVYFSDGGHTGYMYSNDPKPLGSTDLSLGTKLLKQATPEVLEEYVEKLFLRLLFVLGKLNREIKIADILNDGTSLPSIPDSSFFYNLQSLDDRAFYVRNLIREHLKLDWVIVAYPKSPLFTEEDLFGK